MDSEELKKNKIYNFQQQFEKVFDKAKNTKDVDKAYKNLNSEATRKIVLNKIDDEEDKQLITENYDVILEYVYNNYKEKLKDEPIYLDNIESNSDYSDINQEELHNKATIDDYDGPKFRRIKGLNAINNAILVGLMIAWNFYVFFYFLNGKELAKNNLFLFIILSIIMVIIILRNSKEMLKIDGKYNPVRAFEIGLGFTIIFWYIMAEFFD